MMCLEDVINMLPACFTCVSCGIVCMRDQAPLCNITHLLYLAELERLE